MLVYIIKMPQANITYDNPYNKDLVSRLRDMDKERWTHSYDAYHPSPMGYRNADAFHSPADQIVGGVRPEKFIMSGNSPAYPPVSMNAGLAVHSGGARGYAGMDGAVGGKFSFGDLTKGVKDAVDVAKTAKEGYDLYKSFSGGVPSGGKFSLKDVGKVAKSALDVAKTGKDAYDIYSSLSGAGRAGMDKKIKALERKMVGGNWLKDALGVSKDIASIAVPIMMAAGRPLKTMKEKVDMVEKAMKKFKGGSFWKDFGKGFKKGFTGAADVAKEIAPIAVPLMMAAGREQYGKAFNMGKFLEKGVKAKRGKKGGAMVGAYLGKDGKVHHGAAVKGGISLGDVIESTKKMGKAAVKEVAKRGKAAGEDLLKEVGAAAKKSAKKSVNAAAKDVVKATGGGRAKRAEIVKKVMKDKGMKMIEASKYVKEHGLY